MGVYVCVNLCVYGLEIDCGFRQYKTTIMDIEKQDSAP